MDFVFVLLTAVKLLLQKSAGKFTRPGILCLKIEHGNVEKGENIIISQLHKDN